MWNHTCARVVQVERLTDMSPRCVPPMTLALAIAIVVQNPSGMASSVGIVESPVISSRGSAVTTAQTDLPFDIDSSVLKWMKFQELVAQWQKERGARSSITAISMMPTYQRIIGMGEDAVPLILKQLRSEGDQPDQWFWALQAITGANPVDPEDRGDFPKMAQAWLKWGEENYAG